MLHCYKAILRQKRKEKSKLTSKEAHFFHPVSPCICKRKEMEIQQLSVQNLKECLLSVSNMIHMLGSVLNKKRYMLFSFFS